MADALTSKAKSAAEELGLNPDAFDFPEGEVYYEDGVAGIDGYGETHIMEDGGRVEVMIAGSESLDAWIHNTLNNSFEVRLTTGGKKAEEAGAVRPGLMFISKRSVDAPRHKGTKRHHTEYDVNVLRVVKVDEAGRVFYRVVTGVIYRNNQLSKFRLLWRSAAAKPEDYEAIDQPPVAGEARAAKAESAATQKEGCRWCRHAKARSPDNQRGCP